MTNIILFSIVSFMLGFIISMLIFKRKNVENSLLKMMLEFKTTIDDYKNQNSINATEVKEALKGAIKLSKALTTNQNLKGQFGENCLENIIKTCYPELNSDYFKQVEMINTEDKTIKPDFMVKLPENKSILIDCKMNLDKFIEYQESINSNNEKTAKANLIYDINNTLTNLSNKKYETAKDCVQPNFILMYVPLEPLITLIYTDKDFSGVIKNASEKNIIIVGNSSILTVIKLVKQLWAQDTQNKNMENIIEAAENIYNLIATHSQNLAQIKATMEENCAKFQKEYDKMVEGSKLFKYVENLKNYGIEEKTKKEGRNFKKISIHEEMLK